jgi:hypothetical protein
VAWLGIDYSITKGLFLGKECESERVPRFLASPASGFGAVLSGTRDDRFWLQGEVPAFLIDVRFTPRSRHSKGDVRLLRD